MNQDSHDFDHPLDHPPATGPSRAEASPTITARDEKGAGGNTDGSQAQGCAHLHTPGPWQSNNWRVCNTPSETVPIKVICDTANNKRSRTPENEANARLIAAAPSLLDACTTTAKALDRMARLQSEGVPFSREALENYATHLHGVAALATGGPNAK